MVALVLAPCRRAAAQGEGAKDTSLVALRTLTLRVDNDAFDFWEPAWDRPDEDYTSGVRIVYDNAWKPWWSSKIWTRVPRCNGSATPCVTSTAWIGQDTYTAERDSNENLETVGARPSAGWLYYGEEYRRVSADRADLLDLTFGVTGPPSLAQYTQELAHSFAPTLNGPIDWKHQLAFEPGVIAAYEHDEIVTVLSLDAVALQVIPSATATVGNVLTEGTAKVQARLGYNMKNPWLPALKDSPIEFAATASIAGNAVARDLFLDGNTFRKGPRVGHEPFYGERDLGLSLTNGSFTIGYRTVFDARTYATGRPHAWSSLIAGWALHR